MRISDWSSDVCSSDLALDSAANQLFIVPRPVNLGSVEEGDAEIDGAVDGGDRFILAGLAIHVGADASHRPDRKRGVSGKGVAVSVDIRGRRHLKNTQPLKTLGIVSHETEKM